MKTLSCTYISKQKKQRTKEVSRSIKKKLSCLYVLRQTESVQFLCILTKPVVTSILLVIVNLANMKTR